MLQKRITDRFPPGLEKDESALKMCSPEGNY
jgi:hypothetical protein